MIHINNKNKRENIIAVFVTVFSIIIASIIFESLSVPFGYFLIFSLFLGFFSGCVLSYIKTRRRFGRGDFFAGFRTYSSLQKKDTLELLIILALFFITAIINPAFSVLPIALLFLKTISIWYGGCYVFGGETMRWVLIWLLLMLSFILMFFILFFILYVYNPYL